MAYTVNFTDDLNKSPIIVEDNIINYGLIDLALPGRNAVGYGEAVAENFLHLLENFANNTAPPTPVEGQLWYDNSEGIDQLKIYDGTTWSAASGLKRGATAPEVSNSIAGDLWVNTDTQQLFLFNGTTWVLVGPDFSGGLLTGVASENIIGTDDLTYNVLSFKLGNRTVGILSGNQFRPKSAITGFTTDPIRVGLNLFNQSGTVYKFAGVSEKSESILVGTEVVPSDRIIRNDVVANFNQRVKVNNDEGLSVGSNGQFSFRMENETAVVSNASNGASINFRLRSGNTNNTVLRVDATKRVGINVVPEEALDVVGNIQLNPSSDDPDSGVLTINGTVESGDTDEGSLIVSGGAGIGGNLYIGGNLNIGNVISTGNILPKTNNSFNIGSSGNRYVNIYGNNLFGNLTGNVTGNLTGRAGSADRLTSATTFQITGDVSPSSFAFDGITGGNTKTFNVAISSSFIATKSEITDALDSDEILISNTSGLFRINKENFLKTVPVFPTAIIMPYGGTTAPTNWLLCDGKEYLKADYPELFAEIQFRFKSAALIDAGPNNSSTHFAVPDFRGRVPMGLDNMGGTSADVVTATSADTLGQSGGNETTDVEKRHLPDHEHDLFGDNGTQHYGIAPTLAPDTDTQDLSIETGATQTQGLPNSGGILNGGQTGSNDYRTGGLGSPLNVMNPYVALNYIIYTGM